MRTRTFAFFVIPSLAMVVLFIAVPLVSVLVQSFYVTSNEFIMVKTESCTPSISGQVCVMEEKEQMVLNEAGKPVLTTRFVGLDSYRTLLQTDTISDYWEQGEHAFAEWVDMFLSIDFYRALRFTLTFTLFTLPFVIGIGLLLALAVNRLQELWKGPVIFVSLLPFIITPVIGAISIKWLFVGDGIITALLEYLGDKNISVFTNGWAIEGLMLFYRVWHAVPFAFIVFYAGLQTMDRDMLDVAIVDGANRIQRIRYVVIPHLMPLIIFVSLFHLMDAFRVFEEVIGFSSQAYRISLQWLTYDLLTPDYLGNRAISQASASSMLTMVGIIILLVPIIRKTWKNYRV